MPLGARWPALPPTLMGLAATGGLARAATAAWATAGLPGGGVTPRQARACARATGPVAHPEAVTARARAPGADVIRPPPRPLPAAQPQARRALRGRRPPRLGMRTAAPHRLTGASGRLPQASEAHRAGRKARSTPRDADLETLRRASPLWRAHDDLWQSVPGRGPGWARTWLLALPELGTRTRQPMAAWVGVAPLPGDRGTLRGRWTIGGGRAPGRTVWSMGTRVATRLNPQLKAFSQRLRTAGKSHQVALTAWMRKLLTMLHALLKHRTSWQVQEVQN